MEGKELKLNITPNADGSDIILRTGSATKAREKRPVRIEQGLITAPGEFFKLRNRAEAHLSSHIQVVQATGDICLIMDEHNELYDHVTGKIKANPDLAYFSINSNSTNSPGDLARLLKRFKHHFLNSEDNMKLVSSLKNYDAKVEKAIAKANDDRGNMKDHLDRTIKTEIPETFKLKMPIFEGEKEQIITVDIGIEEGNDDIRIFLLSSDLEVYQYTNIATILKRELKIFEDAEIPIINVSKLEY